MQIKIITPDQEVFEGEINQAKFPGNSGGFEVLKDHAPMISILGKGEIVLQVVDQGKKQFSVDGGVVEILHNHITVLLETILE